MNLYQSSPGPSRFRPRRVRGLPATRLADSLAAATTGTEDLEREALARLAERAATLAARARGERGWPRT